MTTAWMSSRPATSGLLTVAAAAFLLSGCGGQSQSASCVNRSTNKVADNSACNNGGSGGAYFFGTGRSGYGQGSVLPAGPRAEVNDPGAGGRTELHVAGRPPAAVSGHESP